MVARLLVAMAHLARTQPPAATDAPHAASLQGPLEPARAPRPRASKTQRIRRLAKVASSQGMLAKDQIEMQQCKPYLWLMPIRQITPATLTPLHVVAGAGQIGPMIAKI